MNVVWGIHFFDSNPKPNPQPIEISFFEELQNED